jgi:predicted polyphosphate/ATP-dependent NAD kinase
MTTIGFLINPVAGMGGAVGLKGTDGNIEEALRRGASPQAKNRAKITLHHLKNNQDLVFLTPSGAMGEDALQETGVQHVQVVSYAGNNSTSQDTKIAVQRFFEKGVDLILFCGGDGTARDIFDVVGPNVPILESLPV